MRWMRCITFRDRHVGSRDSDGFIVGSVDRDDSGNVLAGFESVV